MDLRHDCSDFKLPKANETRRIAAYTKASIGEEFKLVDLQQIFWLSNSKPTATTITRTVILVRSDL